MTISPLMKIAQETYCGYLETATRIKEWKEKPKTVPAKIEEIRTED